MDFHSLRFILFAGLLYGLMHFGYHKVSDQALMTSVYPNVIGNPAARVITTLTPDRNPVVKDNQIRAKGVNLNIVRGCDGSGVWFMLIAAVVSFSLSTEHVNRTIKQTFFRLFEPENFNAFELSQALTGVRHNLLQLLVGLVLGSITVYIINQIRIVGLFYLVEHDRTLFPVVHTYYAPTLIVFLIAGFFLWWTRWCTRHDGVTPSASVPAATWLLGTFSKGFAAVLVLLIAGQFWGDKAVSAFFPYYETIAENANPDYHIKVRMEYDTAKSENMVIASATALKALGITPTRNLAAGRTIEASVTVWHTLVPLILLVALTVIFPVKNLRQRLVLLILTIPAVLLVSAVTAPIQLLGNLEIGFINAAAQAGFSREPSLILKWMLLTEGGARWLIPILVGLGCGAFTRRFVSAKLSKNAPAS